MNYSVEITFDDSTLEALLGSLRPGDTLPAVALLAALDGESEETLPEAFDRLRDLGVTLDVSAVTNPAGTGEAALRLKREAQFAREGLPLMTLEETDPLRLYLEEIAAIPAFGDVCLLAEELAEANREKQDKPELWTQLLNSLVLIEQGTSYRS